MDKDKMAQQDDERNIAMMDKLTLKDPKQDPEEVSPQDPTAIESESEFDPDGEPDEHDDDFLGPFDNAPEEKQIPQHQGLVETPYTAAEHAALERASKQKIREEEEDAETKGEPLPRIIQAEYDAKGKDADSDWADGLPPFEPAIQSHVTDEPINAALLQYIEREIPSPYLTPETQPLYQLTSGVFQSIHVSTRTPTAAGRAYLDLSLRDRMDSITNLLQDSTDSTQL